MFLICNFKCYYQFEIFVPISMTHFSTLLANTLTHITIGGKVSHAFYLILRLLTTLQTISIIVDQATDLFQVVKWFDPNNYQDPILIMAIGLTMSLAFLVVLSLRLIVSQKSKELVRPSTLLCYIDTLLLYLQTVCKTVLLVPLLRACLLLIRNPPNSATFALALFALLLYLLFLFPILAYNTLNTFVLTPQLNRIINFWNAYLWMSVFRVVFVFGNVINSAAMPFLCAFFFFVYFALTIKRPIFFYAYEKLKKAMVASVGYASLVRVLNAVVGGRSNSVLVEILGFFCFAALVEWISAVRIKRILEREQPSIFQFKVLFFMAGNLEQNLSNLQYFIMGHHQKCSSPTCLCVRVLDHLSARDSNFKEDRIWYQFLYSYAKSHYCLEEIVKLPESELRAKVDKYQYIVVDLVEVALFKLGKLNEAYYTLSNFESLLERKQTESLVFRQKSAVMKFYLEQAIGKKYKVDGATNQYADKYMNFQIEFENYRKLLLRAATKTAELWEEMNKRQPYQKKLLQDLKTLQVQNYHIKILYHKIVEQFQKADEVLQEITNDYFEMVLNIAQRSSFHMIEIPKFYDEAKKRKEKVQRLSENMQSFSFDSETPMCFVSVESEGYGKITNFNSFFSEIMKLQYGKFVSIEEFIIPEMRSFHRRKMQEFINGDFLSKEHRNGFTLNSKGKLVYTKILIQIMPTISNGLHYAVFFKKLMWDRKIVGIKNMHETVYQSQSFESFMQNKFHQQPLMSYLTLQVQQQLKTIEKVQLRIPEGDFEIKQLHEFNQKEAAYLFLQIIDLNQLQFTSTFAKAKDTEKTGTNGFLTKKDQIMESGDKSCSDIEEGLAKIMENNDVNQKQLIDKERKNEEKIRQTYEIILNTKQRHLSSSMNVLIKVTAIIKIILFAVIIIIKYQNQTDYLTASDIHDKYNQYMLLISRFSLNFKQVNLYTYQNSTSTITNYIFKNLQTQPLIGQAMDKFLYIFDIPTVSQNWYSFSVNSKNITVATENNFLAVSDNLINPVTNLISSNVSSFNFPIAIEYLSSNGSSVSTFFNQLITNTLYTHLPKFRALKQVIMNPIIINGLSNYWTIIIVNFLLLITIMCWVVWALYKHKKILTLKTVSYKILQKLKGDLIKQKELNCLKFYKKYSYIETQLRVQDKLTKFQGSNYDKMINANSQFDSQEEKEYEFRQNQGSVFQQTKLQDLQKQKLPKNSNLDKIGKNFKIFEETSFVKTFFKYTLPCIPLVVYLIAFTTFEFIQNNRLRNVLKIQQNVQNMQQDITYIRLYSMHYGIYDSTLQKYQSIPGTLQNLINQMFAYEKVLLNSNKIDNLPLLQAYIRQIFYGNICELQQRGIFAASKFSFYGRGNLSNCLNISGQMLTKGLISSLLNYIQSASNLFYANPNVTRQNLTQKLAYLNNPFFTDISKLAEYFDLVFDTALRILISDYKNQVSNYTLATTFCCGFLIIWFIIMILFFRRYYLKILKWDILQIHAVFSLITYESLVKNDYLKSIFAQKLDQFSLLE